MKSILIRFFTENWQRKLASLILAIFIWLVVHHSMTSTRNFQNVPVSIMNIPDGMTIEGLQSDGRLKQRVSFNLTGNKQILDDIQSTDLQIVIDAKDRKTEWTQRITKKNLSSNVLDVHRSISHMSDVDFFIKLCPLVSKKIPVLVSQPTGEAPKGYQYLDVWPYQLFLSVTGPEALVHRLKSRGLKLTFNLNDVNKEDLDTLTAENAGQDAIQFFIPDSWKQLYIPALSDQPIQIDDPRAKKLRVDFAKRKLYALNRPIPITIFFPAQYSDTINPMKYSFGLNNIVQQIHGIDMVSIPLYVDGVSRQFLDIVKDMVQIVLIASPDWENGKIAWNTQVVNRHELEDVYVAKVMSQAPDDIEEMNPLMQEAYLRNRFRSYMNKFRLYTDNDQKLNLVLDIKNNQVFVTHKNRE